VPVLELTGPSWSQGESIGLSSSTQEEPVVLAIDQGTTNTKAVWVTARGQVVATGSAPVGVSSPRAGWVEQDADRIWASVLAAVEAAGSSARAAGSGPLVALALSTQRESIVAWRASTGEAIGPVIGWQDRRTAQWCADAVGGPARELVQRRTGLRVDPMFSAPKMRWLLDRLPAGVPRDDVRIGTIETWLVWRLTAGAAYVCEAGNASRTLLYDMTSLDWSDDLLAVFGIDRNILPAPLPSAAAFGSSVGVPGVRDGTPITAILADSHAALYGHGCTEVGMAKATYGTGSSVMTPVAEHTADGSAVPTTLAWLIDDAPQYALEGNILSSGATLAWAAGVLTGGDVTALLRRAATVPDAGGVTLVPAFTGLGAPHWDRDASALLSGLTTSTTEAHLARAAVDAIAHQICDIVEVIEATTGPLRTFRADGGASAADLVMQTQADLLDRTVEVADMAEVSALGAAKLAWRALGRSDEWPAAATARRFSSQIGAREREQRRRHWAGEVARARLKPGTSGSEDTE
jgi:glycerol kinase